MDCDEMDEELMAQFGDPGKVLVAIAGDQAKSCVDDLARQPMLLEIAQGVEASARTIVAGHMVSACKRVLAEPQFECKAAILTDPPQDCDWPFCGCDPHANRVLETLEEEGKLVR